MEKNSLKYQTYVEILKKELVPAMGCTEPIALAYCAAKAREVLGELPGRIEVEASGNIIKNVKSVVVPNTGGQRGIEAAVGIGILAGDAAKELEVLSSVTREKKEQLPAYLNQVKIQVEPAQSGYLLDIQVRVYGAEAKASVRIAGKHTNIIRVEKNGEVLLDREEESTDKREEAADGEMSQREKRCGEPDYSLLNVEDICAFAQCADLEDVREILERQIAYNTAISEEGFQGDYGANIGSVLLKSYGDSVKNRAKARAAAGSDARMNGCELPVVINSGSGNQGMTVSLPVLEFAKELGSSQEDILRALIISNLTAIHQKTGIGSLSAYCGAVSAGAGAGAGIAYLRGGRYREIAHTIVNTLAITSGIICDGAKASCAAKIATAVDAGILGYDMYLEGQQFYGGDGVVSKGVENTIKNIGRLGRDGMRETDREILHIKTCVD